MILFTFTASFAQNHILFIVLFVLGVGITKGLSFTACLKQGWTAMPNRKGLISGIVMSGMSTGSVIYGILCTRLVNPLN